MNRSSRGAAIGAALALIVVVVAFWATWATGHGFIRSLVTGLLAGLVGVFVVAVLGVITGRAGGPKS